MLTSRFLTYVLLLILLLLNGSAWANFEQCNETVQTIPVNNTAGISSSITITDTSIGVIKTIGISQLDLEHGNVGELTFKLSNGSSTVILLEMPDTTSAKPEGCVGKDFDDTEISDDGSKAIQTNCKEDQPAYGSSDFTPKEALSIFTGDNAADIWTFTVIDNNDYGSGTLNKWCIKYTVESAATVTLSPSEGTSLDFGGGTIETGNTETDSLTITETTGSFSLVVESANFTGSDKANFALTSHDINNDFPITITPGNTDTYEISCTPSDRGTHTAIFHLYTNLPAPYDELTYPLTCEGIGAGYDDNGQSGTIDFGDIDVDTTSSVETITISEDGELDLEISKIKLTGSGSGDFTLTGKPSLPHTIGQGSGSSLDLEVTCTPTEVGERTATISIKTNDITNATNDYTLKCTGKGAIYESGPDPGDSLSFGSGQPGVDSTRNISIYNTGNETLTISDVDFTDSGDGSAAAFSLSISLGLGLDIPANGTDELPIECSSATEGSYTTTVSVTHNGADSPAEYTITCETNSAISPEFNSMPIIGSTLSMDESVEVGETTQSILYVYEIGTDTVTVDLTDSANPFGDGDDAEVFSIISPSFPISIIDGSMAQAIQIQCAPTHKGTHTATLSLTHNGTNATNPATYTVSCEGKAPVYVNKTILIGSTLDVGEATIGNTTADAIYKVRNEGDADLIVDNMTITGSHASDFTLRNPSDGDYTKNPNKNMSVKVRCTPSSIGLRTATLSVETNDPEYPTIDYGLECTGKRPIGAGYASIPIPNSTTESGNDIGEIEFTAVSVGGTSSTTLDITEGGTAVLKVYQDSPLISGTNAADFAITNNLSSIFDKSDGGFHIADGSGGEVTLNLSCTPSAVGVRTAYLYLISNGKIFTNPAYKMTCEGLQPAYSSDPEDSIDFGNTDIGVKVTETLSISETGTDTLTVNLADEPITGDHVDEFAIEDDSIFPISIADGDSDVDVELSCTPSGKENRTATLNLTSNDPDKPTISYSLTCYGNPKPAYDSEPEPEGEIDLGGGYLDVAINGILTIKEIGTDTLEVELADTPFTGDHADDFSIDESAFPLNIDDGGDEIEVSLTCTPSAEGVRTAVLNLTSNDEDLPEITYSVECIGSIEPIPVYGSNPTVAETISFGSIEVGQTLNQTLSIQERGNTTLTIDLATSSITGTHASDFSIDSSLFPMAIADGGDSVDVGLTCTPSAKGTRTATLNLASNDTITHSSISYDLTCKGIVIEVEQEPTTAPTLPHRKLTIQFEGNGFGTVTTLPADVDCSNHGAHEQCENEYLQSAKLQLAATPHDNSYFVGWSNNCKSEAIALDNDITCIANFKLLPKYTLNVLVIGKGEVNSNQYPSFNCHSAKTEKCFLTDLIQDTTVNLQPTPAEGWSFAAWEADCDTNGQVLMTSNKACHAIFTPNTTEQVKFSVNIRSGSGTVQSDSVPELACQNNTGLCAGEYNIQTIMGIIAIPNSPYIFIGWSGDCSDAGKSATHSVQLIKPETHCIADFALPPPDPEELPSEELQEPNEIDEPEVLEEPDKTDEPEETIEKEQPEIKCLTEGRLNYACNAEGEIVQDLTVLPHGSISHIVVEGDIDNQGWVSDSHVKSGGKISGGTLTGQTKVDDGGVLENVTLKGDLIEGGTLRGEIRNQSPVGGVIKDVLLDDNAVIKGGYVEGTIEGNPTEHCQPTARLENVIVLPNTVLNNIVIGEEVKFGRNVVIGDCVIVADGSIYRPDQDEVDDNGIVHLAKDSYVNDGELKGDFVGDDDGLPLLEDVLIGQDSTVDNVILGQDVVNHGEVTNFELRGIDFRGGTIGGEIDVTRGGTIEDVTLVPNTKIDGGNFKGEINGDPNAPATITNGFINADACINNVILAQGTVIAEGACIGDNVIDEEPESKLEEEQELEDMLQVEPNGDLLESEASFDPRVAVCDIPRTNNTLLSKRDAKGLELQAHIGVDPIHQGLAGEMLMMARHNFNGIVTDVMKLADGSWVDWHEGIDIEPFQTFDALPEGIDTFVFKGDLGQVRGEISVFMGYRLADGTTVYNGGEPLHVFIDTTPDTCLVYAIHDEGLNISQPVIIDLSVGLDGDMRLLGTTRTFYGYDIEGMELHPDDDNLLLGTGGDDSNVYGKQQDGNLYTINKTTGHIKRIGRIVSSDGSIKFEQVAGIALHPITKQLWGWGIVNKKDQFMAILHIDHTTGVAQIHKQFEHSQLNNVTGLTWDRDGSVMFMSSEDRVWRYNPNTQKMKVACEGISDQVIGFLKGRSDSSQLKLIGGRKGEIEGLDIQPNGWLLIGIDYQASTASSIVAYDAETCEVKQIQTFRNSVFHDLESVVWPVKACNDQSWLNEDPCAEFNQ
ncbi:choice-of-anchor D domain-containing protein [Candidatus Albibeggiatoa sp. nov. BB20]|uniref:choice-of-anchor D domain-containing protein n=1 Tax=Candidatus Albibeggiatoa sp. nov. BB20 TaxID=3162723 RepID=UPI003365AB4A